MRRFALRMVMALACAMLWAGAAAAQQAIPTGGPIPDVRGFNDKIKDPAAVAQIKFVVRHVAGHAYVIAGAGGNVGVLAGEDGILLVDDNFTVFYDQIVTLLRQISTKPVRFVLNTHAHIDHVQNNENFARQGATIIATPGVREAMLRADGGNSSRAGIPVITATDRLTIHFDGEDVVFVPLKPAHTDGDAAVYFRGADVWSFGDVYRTDYPSMGESGTTANFIDDYNLALQMTTPNTIFLPGHGQLSRREELTALRDAVITIHTRLVDMVAKGMTFDQILQARPSKDFDARFASENKSATTGNTVERWYRAMYAEATKAPKQ
jgi:cyclase